MSAAAQLARPVAKADDPNDVAVLLLEEMHRALGDRFLVGFLAFVKRQSLADLFHDATVDAVELISRDRAVERDVEGRVVGSDPRSLLHDLLTERPAQGLVEDLGGW